MLVVLLSSLVLGLIVSAAVTSNCGNLQPNITYYSVKGNTSDEIRNNLGKACGADGCFDGYATTGLYSMPTCVGGNYRFEMTASITVPAKLNETASSNPTLIKNFNTFVDSLLEHELKHIANGRATCNYFVQELSKDSACNFSPERINEILNAGWRQANAADTNLDQTTSHGMKEGACFHSVCPVECNGCAQRYIDGNTFPPRPSSTSAITTTTTTQSGSSVSTTITRASSSSSSSLPTSIWTSTGTTSTPTSSTSSSLPTRTSPPDNSSIINSSSFTNSPQFVVVFLGIFSTLLL